MKKLLMVMTSITTSSMQTYLQQMGYEVVVWQASYDGNATIWAEELWGVLDDSYYGVFMYNYYPEFAQVCYDKKLYYMTWIVDNPHFSLWSNTVKYETNRIFVFDKSQLELLKMRGVEQAFYLPLGADVEFFDTVDYKKGSFPADVSFVGSLYNEPSRNMFAQLVGLPPYIDGYMNALVQAQQKVPENIINRDVISQEVWKALKQCVNLVPDDAYDFPYEECFLSILQKEVTRRERCQAVTLLQELFNFKLYTGSSLEFNPKLKKESYVDYATEMPMVFRQSKVNINITVRSITSGIPLRALDIMACKGMLLSNYQRELLEYFEEDKECVFYYDLEDMAMKTDFYIRRDEERERIALAGYEKVRKEFSLRGQLEKMKLMLEQAEG